MTFRSILFEKAEDSLNKETVEAPVYFERSCGPLSSAILYIQVDAEALGRISNRRAATKIRINTSWVR